MLLGASMAQRGAWTCMPWQDMLSRIVCSMRVSSLQSAVIHAVPWRSIFVLAAAEIRKHLCFLSCKVFDNSFDIVQQKSFICNIQNQPTFRNKFLITVPETPDRACSWNRFDGCSVIPGPKRTQRILYPSWRGLPEPRRWEQPGAREHRIEFLQLSTFQ